MANKTSKAEQDMTESYLDNDIPKLLKLFFIGIIIWGVLFALYFILTGYDSEKRFQDRKVGAVSVFTSVT